MDRVDQQALLEETGLAPNRARGVDVGRKAAVGTAQEGTALFDGSKSTELKVLQRAAVAPYQVSFVMLTRTSAPLRTKSRANSGKMPSKQISVANRTPET